MDQLDLLRFVVEILEAQGLTYLLVGSFASAVYGEPRMTRDIDVVLRVDRQQVDRLCAAFPSPEFYAPSSMGQEAVATGGQFNVIHPASGNKIDFMIGRDDAWGRSQLSRRLRKPVLSDLDAYVAAPEDVILGKLWYYHEGMSDKHLRDIVGMLKVSDDDIDRHYIDEWSERLGLAEPWKAALAQLS